MPRLSATSDVHTYLADLGTLNWLSIKGPPAGLGSAVCVRHRRYRWSRSPGRWVHLQNGSGPRGTDQGPAERIRARKTNQGLVRHIRAHRRNQGPAGQIRTHGTGQGPTTESGLRRTSQGPTTESGLRRTSQSPAGQIMHLLDRAGPRGTELGQGRRHGLSPVGVRFLI